MQNYVNYAAFEEQVFAATGATHYEAFKHILPGVSIHHRDRFLQTLQHAQDIPNCSKLVHDGLQLPDHHYSRYLKYIMGAKTPIHAQLH